MPNLSRFDELKATNRLPSPTGVALTILKLADREDTSVADIAKAMQADPALTGRVLKLANSARASRLITTVRDAVACLGMRTVRNLALGFALIARGVEPRRGGFDHQRFWSHSLAMAVGAQAVATAGKTVPAEDAFTCGLLARVGQLGLATIYPDEYLAVRQTWANGSPQDLIALERQHFSIDSTELTAAMLRDWGLPADYALAVQHYERPTTPALATFERARAVAALLALAAQFAEICIGSPERRAELMPLLLAHGERLSLTADVLLPLGDRVAQDWESWGTFLAIPTEKVPAFDKLRQAPRPAAAGSPAIPASGLTVLVIDDDPVERHLIAHYLERAGHQVLRASDGQEGLQMALTHLPALIITDWLMPGLDGLEVCRKLRLSRIGREFYIIVLTGNGQDRDVIQAFDAGADDFVVKPVSPEVLLARLQGGQRLLRLHAEVTREQEDNRRITAELALANRQLQQAALTDVLTGLANRRHGLQMLAQLWVAPERVVSCLLIDVDFFKRVNDTYGHDAGDRVLCHVAQTLGGNCRAGDLVCRFGGEEFLVICPGTDTPEAMAIAERLRALVADTPLTEKTATITVTLSVGVATRSDATPLADDLIKFADNAVYAAKHAGRNRVAVADRTTR